jgi:ABC-type glycerol-3-phosphate transport system substrate-binding protein
MKHVFATRMISLFLVLLMLTASFAGCSKGNKDEDTSGNDVLVETGDKEGTSDEAEATEAPVQDVSADIRGNTAPTQEQMDLVNNSLNDSYLGDVYTEVIPNDYSAYPFKEEVELEVWMPSNSILASVVPNLDDHPVFIKVEELTGINLKFITPPVGQEADNFTLMMASGELPDIIIDPGRYPGGVDAGVRDGAYIDLTDKMDEYAPNYSAWRNSDEMRRKTTVSDDGKLSAFHGIAPYSEWMWFGMLIKQEALDKTGLEVPNTVDEWHNFLTASKAAGYNEPLNYGSTYGQIFTGIINGAYGVWDWVFVNEEGKAAWGPAQAGAKDYLTTMRQWEEEGLLNSDWVTADFNQRMAEAISDDCAVMMDSPDTMWGYWKTDNNIDFVGALNPVLNEGDKAATTYLNFKKTGTSAAITTQCENVEAAMAFLDFAYTKKGWELYNFGEYGTVHLVDKDGRPYFHADGLMYNDPEGQPLSNLIWKYRIHSFANIRDEHFSNPLITAEGSYSGDIREYWTENMDAGVAMPPITFTSDEASREAELGTQLSTLRGEYFAKIIKGELPVDAYDEFLKKANQMGLQEFVGLWQAALDRYNAR